MNEHRINLIKWGLENTITKVSIGYTLITDDSMKEWIQLESASGYKRRVSISMFNEIFEFGIGYPRSVVHLKQSVKARETLEKHAREKEQIELLELERLKKKYEQS